MIVNVDLQENVHMRVTGPLYSYLTKLHKVLWANQMPTILAVHSEHTFNWYTITIYLYT